MYAWYIYAPDFWQRTRADKRSLRSCNYTLVCALICVNNGCHLNAIQLEIPTSTHAHTTRTHIQTLEQALVHYTLVQTHTCDGDFTSL